MSRLSLLLNSIISKRLDPEAQGLYKVFELVLMAPQSDMRHWKCPDFQICRVIRAAMSSSP
jgi:hypothetical protein